MALQSCRIGNVPNAIQWDDAIHSGAIETTQVIKAGTPVAANDVVTLATLGTYVSSAAVIADHAIVRGDGGARGIQDSLATIDDAGSISLVALATVDGRDISVDGTALDTVVGLQHNQGTDTALGAVSTKNPPIDADKVIYRDSAAADVLVTSTWTQIKAFLRVYLDTIYHILGGDLGTPSAADLANCTGLPTAGLATQVFAAGIGIGGAAADTGGIAFPATAVPSADPNTLDDYEEGEYDVTIACGTSGTVTVSAAANTAAYTKIGRVVHVQGGVTIDSVSSPVGEANIALPFTATALTEGADFPVGSVSFNNVNYVSTGWVNSYVPGGASVFRLLGTNDNGAAITESADIFSASDSMKFQISYIAE